MDGRPMRDWRLPIQPNSLIAVFSTIAKSALLVPLAECIGQLKWTYFQTPQSKPVNRLYDFDVATRGPWGAFTFVYKLRLKKSAALASFGAALTILSLGFEPFTQQVLRVYSKPALLVNATGTVSSSNSFSDASSIEKADLIGIVHPLTVDFTDHVALQDINLLSNVYCPTIECKLDEFTSLGLCESCSSEDVTFDGDFWNGGNLADEDFRGCGNFVKSSYNATYQHFYFNYTAYTAMTDYVAATQPYQWGRMCNIKKSGYPELVLWITTSRYLNESYPSITAVDPGDTASGGYQFGIIRLTRSKIDGTYSLFSAPDGSPTFVLSTEFPPQIEYCVGNFEGYQVAMEPFKLPLQAISVFTCFKSTSDLTRVGETDRLGLVNGTISHCQLSYCAKRYHNITVRNTVVNYGSVEEFPLIPTGDDPYKVAIGYDQAFRAEDLNETFYLGNYSRLWLAASTSRILKSTTLSTYFFEYFLHHTWSYFFQGLAQVGSKVIQGPGNFAAINNTSDAYGPEIFVDVRWAWLAYPLALLVYSALFLFLTALGSRRRSYLFKNSILAVLVHGLEGWDAVDCPELLTVAKERNSDLKRALGPAKASLIENDDGLLKLKRD
ncbi:uncharacterized protein J4E78_008670 [Alternaria triticimaculans]|uniref:uncharacterized protein n=1 Tax=Alternaria triticimaculans TaxID=297637 RepID=UPI0020C1EB0D|nr:uncharacterized protein J4E78_008670 [Alternaria triticimaculans]KAI4648607.1 hypothetical protein J4E78_008670 [Alternaria triticimaculans]